MISLTIFLMNYKKTTEMKEVIKNDDLYVLYNPINYKTKVGRTKDFDSRLAGIKTASGISEIKVVTVIEKEGDFEPYIHHALKKVSYVGEWYEDHSFIFLFKNMLEQAEMDRIPLEDFVLRILILSNELFDNWRIENCYTYSKFRELTDPFIQSARDIYDHIKKERKGIGWGVQTKFIDFIRYKKMIFKNFDYLILSKDKKTYEMKRVSKSKVKKKHIMIEELKMSRNVLTDKSKVEKIQQEIDLLYEQTKKNE